MEQKRLLAEWESLVTHIRTVDYSKMYVRQMEMTVASLIEAAPSLVGWIDIREWAAKWSREGVEAVHIDATRALSRTLYNVTLKLYDESRGSTCERSNDDGNLRRNLRRRSETIAFRR